MVNGGHVVAMMMGGAVVALGMRAHYAKRDAMWAAMVEALRARLRRRAA